MVAPKSFLFGCFEMEHHHKYCQKDPVEPVGEIANDAQHAEKEGAVHRMAYETIGAGSDQLRILSDIGDDVEISQTVMTKSPPGQGTT